MKNRKILLVSILMIITFLIAGCSKDNNQNRESTENTYNESKDYPMTVTDSYERKVEIEKEPFKVISIAPNITEIIFALNKGDRLVGRTEYCDYPKEVFNIPSIGSLKEPSIEKILDLDPDVVIASTHFQKETLEKLEDMGVKVLVLYGQESFEGVYETVEKVGLVLNSSKEAQNIITGMKKKVEDVQNKVKDKPKPEVYYVVGFGKGGDYTAGKDTFINQMIQMAGGKNVADDVEGWSYSIERLLEKDPQMLICSKYNNAKEGIKGTNGYNELEAVKKGNVFEIDNNLLDRQGTRLGDGLVELAKIIHPEVF